MPQGRRFGKGGMVAASGGWVILAAGWLTLVVILIMLGQAAEMGPVAWFDSWLAVRGGQLRGLQLSMLVLMLPAAYLLRAAIRRAIRVEAPTSTMRRTFLLTSMALGVIGLVCVAVAANAYVRYAEATDAAAKLEPAIELSSDAALAEAAATRQRVALTGAPIHHWEIRFGWGERRALGFSTYTAFRPGGMRRETMEEGPGSPPATVIVEEVDYSAGPPGTPIAHRPQQDRIEGYLIENGLPDHARTVLVREGVPIAEPHYLFRADRDGPALELLDTVMSAGFNGALLLCFAFWLAFRGAVGRKAS